MNGPTIENPQRVRDYRRRYRKGGIVEETTVWLAFPKGDQQAARRVYRERTGELPPYSRTQGRLLLLGPIEREESS